MTSRQIRPSQSLDKRIFELLDDTWRTVGDIRRLLGGGTARSAWPKRSIDCGKSDASKNMQCLP